jgi:hypothetical protein
VRGLTQIGTKRKRLDFAVWDLEWYPRSYELRLVGCYDQKHSDFYRSYFSIAEFLETELTEETRGRTFFAHAGGLADIQFVFAEALNQGSLGWKLHAAMSGSSAIRVKCTRGTDSWIFADSYWLLRDSLKKIGQSLGKKKLSDYLCHTWPDCGHFCEARARDGVCPHPILEGCGHCVFYSPMGTLRSYNERDCEILYEAIDRFQDELREIADSGGQLRRTIAATALDLFRRSFLSEDIPTNPHLNEQMRPAYIASRVEPIRPFFKASKKHPVANYYDFNSSFASSMTKPQPGQFLGRQKLWKGDPCSFVRAKISVPEDTYIPPLGYRSEKTRAIFFPTGTWTSLFSGTDLELLEEFGGRIERVHLVYRYAPFTDLAAYALEIYERRRLEKDEFRRLVYKYLLNALYGKFGESSEKQSLVLADDPVSLPGYAEGRVESVRPGVYKVSEYGRVEHAHVAIAASITSMSRALLSRKMRDASQDGNRLFYSDTDSVITTAELPSSDALGALKLEQTITSGTFLAPKMYMVDDKPRVKGFPRLSPEWFRRIASGEGLEVRRMARLWEMVNSKAGPMIAPSDRVYQKHVRLLARPKRASAGESDTRPWTVKELEK